MGILLHVWTCLLLIFAIIFLVMLPYEAIVQSSILFWFFVISGLSVSFICAACETAFALACGEDTDSKQYDSNFKEQKRLEDICLSDTISESEKMIAKRSSEKLKALLDIGKNYKSIYNPTLVVTNNVAIIAVAVLSGIAQFPEERPDKVQQYCKWLYGSSAIPKVESFRCVSVLGHMIPFPVNFDVFQSAFSLTIILIIGEMLPKQIGSVFPAEIAASFLRPLKLVSVVSLGTGGTFGAAGLKLEKFLSNYFPKNRQSGNDQTEQISPSGPDYKSVTIINNNIATCDGGDGTFGHPRVYLKVNGRKVVCPYCSREFEMKRNDLI